MPYIPMDDRPELDSRIAECHKGWDACYHLVKDVFNPTRYHHWARCIAVFECAYLEAERRYNSEFEWSSDPFLTLPAGITDSVQQLSRFIAINFHDPDGALNYCCTLLAEHPTDLLAAKEFMYANDIGPYEDKAIEKNGDLPIYEARSAAEGQ